MWRDMSSHSSVCLRLEPIEVSLYQVSLLFSALFPGKNQKEFCGCKFKTLFKSDKKKVQKN